MLRAGRADGFTLVEVIVALTIFMVGVLGLGAAGLGMIRNAMELEEREVAFQVVDSRLTEVSMDPRYSLLDSLYSGTDTVLGRFSRTTTVVRTQTAVSGGGVLDYQTVDVVVSGGRLEEPLSKSLTVAAP